MGLTEEDLEEFLAESKKVAQSISSIVKYYTRNGKKIDPKSIASEGVAGLIDWQNQFVKKIEALLTGRIADIKRSKKVDQMAHTFLPVSTLQTFIRALMSSLKTAYLCTDETWQAMLLDLVKIVGISLSMEKKLFVFTTVKADVASKSVYGRVYYSTQELI